MSIVLRPLIAFIALTLSIGPTSALLCTSQCDKPAAQDTVCHDDTSSPSNIVAAQRDRCLNPGSLALVVRDEASRRALDGSAAQHSATTDSVVAVTGRNAARRQTARIQPHDERLSRPTTLRI